jgi:hypothetical protein
LKYEIPFGNDSNQFHQGDLVKKWFFVVGLATILISVGCSSPTSAPAVVADSYSSFRFYNGNQFNDPGSLREWRKLDDTHWQEAYSNGNVTTLQEVQRTVVQGIPGVRYKKLNLPGEEVFIPSRSSGDLQLKWRKIPERSSSLLNIQLGNGGGEWRSIGTIIDPK